MRSHLLVAATALSAALAANWAVAGTAGAASTGVAAARSSLSAATQRDLLRLFARDRGIPVADIAGIAPGAVLGPRTSGGRNWAMVSFRPVADAPGTVKLLLQDGGATGVFTKSAGHSWILAGLGGVPAGCGVPIPEPVRSAWHLPSCQGQASRVPAITRTPESAVAGTTTDLANIALAQVGVAVNPASTSFSYDCNPYTTLAGNPDGAADCGTRTSHGSWFSNVENANEEWCADFTKWVWERAGVTSDLGVLTPSAASFYTWGVDHGEKISFGGTPKVGDAVLFYPAGTSAPNGSYADHVGIVASINSNGSLNLVDGDFLGSSTISVQYNTDVPGPSWYSSGEEWAFVSSQLPTASAPAPSLIGFVTPSGGFYVKEGGLSAAWTQEEGSGVASIALASDGVHGPLIGFRTTSGAFYVKEGGLSAAWTQEEGSGVASIALASDGVHGPLIGFRTTSGAFYVKEGGLSAAWTQEEGSGVASIALASDGVHGPLIGFRTTSGAFYVKEGGLSAAWTQEEGSGVASIALASDSANGPLIGFQTASGAFYVKKGGLSAAWTQEEASGVASIALASDGVNGPLIGFKAPSGGFYAKEGGLSAAWTQEEASGVVLIALAPSSGD